MKRNWPLVAFYFAVGVFPLVAAIDELIFRRCTEGILAEVLTDKPNFGCAEFFLNRYQSLIGNVIAAAVTGSAVYWAARQLVAANRQAASATATALRVRVRELEDELEADDQMRKIYNVASIIIFHLSIRGDSQRVINLAPQITDCVSQHMALHSRFRAWARANANSSLNDARLIYLSSVEHFGLILLRVDLRIRVLSDQSVLSEADLAYFKECVSSLNEDVKFGEAQKRFREMLEVEIARNWTQIRNSESAAF